MDPQQELFTAVKLAIEGLGYDVYDGHLPPDNTPYPFVYLGNSMQTDSPNKSCICGNIDQTIHIWSDQINKRGSLSKMLLKIKNVCRQIRTREHYNFYLINCSQNIMNDDTTSTPLLHGILDIEFAFT